MIKNRRLVDSKVSNAEELSKLTNIQKTNLELLLNARKGNTVFYDYKTGCFYKERVIPASLNDISKACGKRIHKLFGVLGSKGIVRQVVDLQGREVWMLNPDVYWDYVSYELYYNRWLWSVGTHIGASKIVDASLYYGYFYHSITGEPVKRISNYHWRNMFKWWKLYIGDMSPDLLKESIYKRV